MPIRFTFKPFSFRMRVGVKRSGLLWIWASDLLLIDLIWRIERFMVRWGWRWSWDRWSGSGLWSRWCTMVTSDLEFLIFAVLHSRLMSICFTFWSRIDGGLNSWWAWVRWYVWYWFGSCIRLALEVLVGSNMWLCVCLNHFSYLQLRRSNGFKFVLHLYLIV